MGKPYRVGWRPTSQGSGLVNRSEIQTQKKDFDWDIWWAPGPDEWEYVWIGNPFRDSTGIHKYKLWYSNGWFYDYTLDIHSDALIIYEFHDESGDTYTLWAFVYGEHRLNYNSDCTTMIRVHN